MGGYNDTLLGLLQLFICFVINWSLALAERNSAMARPYPTGPYTVYNGYSPPRVSNMGISERQEVSSGMAYGSPGAGNYDQPYYAPAYKDPGHNTTGHESFIVRIKIYTRHCLHMKFFLKLLLFGCRCRILGLESFRGEPRGSSLS